MGANTLIRCNNCGHAGLSKLKGSTWISFLGFWLLAMIPGIIYMIWRRSGLGICKSCGSSAVAPVAKSNLNTNEAPQGSENKTALNSQPKHTPISRPQTECPKCLEMVLVGATKCKHCGEDIIAI